MKKIYLLGALFFLFPSARASEHKWRSSRPKHIKRRKRKGWASAVVVGIIILPCGYYGRKKYNEWLIQQNRKQNLLDDFSAYRDNFSKWKNRFTEEGKNKGPGDLLLQLEKQLFKNNKVHKACREEASSHPNGVPPWLSNMSSFLAKNNSLLLREKVKLTQEVFETGKIEFQKSFEQNDKTKKIGLLLEQQKKTQELLRDLKAIERELATSLEIEASPMKNHLTFLEKEVRWRRHMQKLKEKQKEKVQNFVCAICQEETTKDRVTTSCGHDFHAQCIFEWMDVKPECPYCRKQISTRDLHLFNEKV